MSDPIQAALGQKASEVSVEQSDGKPPYKRKIKTESDTVRELSGKSPISISTEVDPDFKEEDATEEAEDRDSAPTVDKDTD